MIEVSLVGDRTFFPHLLQQRESFVKHFGALFTFDPKCRLFVNICDSESERWQQTAVGEPVQAGKFFRQNGQISAGKDHDRKAKLHFGGSARGVSQTDNRVGAFTTQALAEPQRVETELLEGIDERIKG